MIKRTLSITSQISKEDIILVSKKTIFQTTNITSKILIKLAKALSDIMSSSNGRKKICGLIQYTAKLKYYCSIHSNIPELREKFNMMNKEKKLLSGKIEETMSKNKKIFMFLKFVDEFYVLTLILKDKKKYDPLLGNMMVLSRLASCIYFLLDNFLWAINTGILSDWISNDKYKELKYVKNTSSFWRNIFAIVLDIFKYKHYQKKSSNLAYRFRMGEKEKITKKSDNYAIFKELIAARKKSRMSVLEVIHSCVRLLMLWKDLKYPQSEFLNPIFIALIGNISQWIDLFKFSLKKKEKKEDTSPPSLEKKDSDSNNELKKAKSKGKKSLIRSLSSVFRQVDEVTENSESIDDHGSSQGRGSFLMPRVDSGGKKKFKSFGKHVYFSTKSVVVKRK